MCPIPPDPLAQFAIHELKRKVSGKTRRFYIRHGIAADRTLSVSVADRKAIVGNICETFAQTGKSTSKQLGAVSVEVGDSAGQIPPARAYIEEIEISGRIGK